VTCILRQMGGLLSLRVTLSWYTAKADGCFARGMVVVPYGQNMSVAS